MIEQVIQGGLRVVVLKRFAVAHGDRLATRPESPADKEADLAIRIAEYQPAAVGDKA